MKAKGSPQPAEDVAILILCLFQEGLELVVLKHIIEGLAQFVRNLLDLQLLSEDLVLDVVDPLVQLGDVHLAVLITAFSNLKLMLNVQDLVFQLLLSLNGLLS